MLKNVVRRAPTLPGFARSVGARPVSTAVAARLRENLYSHPNLSNNTSPALSDYPPRKPNTIVHFGKQGHRYVVERFGRFARVETPGFFMTFPVFDRIYEVDTRQLVLDVSRQKAYTSDNVAISVAAQLYITIVDVEKACYHVKQPLVAIMSQAQSALRTTIGKHDLDHLLADRNIINKVVSDALRSATERWGISVERFEITDLTPDPKIQEAMDLQSTAERERRAAVITAEGKREAMTLEAKGKKEAMTLEAEGVRQAADIMSAIPDHMLVYNVTMSHIKMVGSLVGSGQSTIVIPKDMSMLPLMFSEKLKH